jgi:hypothetical protein
MHAFNGLDMSQTQMHHLNANIGISVETVAQIDALTPAVGTNNYVEFAEKMLQNFFNYAASFSQDTPNGQYVPLVTLTNWYENFKRRLIINPNFWKQ